MRLRTVTLAAVAGLLAGVLAACSSSGSSSSTAAPAAAGTPQHGGTLTYLVSGVLASWDLGLDPATGGFAPSIYEDAIYGQLFRLTPAGAIQPVIASGYSLSDGGKVLTISLRQGVKFTDGTPLNAAAVVWNINRDLAPTSSAGPATSWAPLAKNGITTPNDHTVVLTFTKAYADVMEAFVTSNTNHIADPTAYQKMGEKAFTDDPVGAGPFIVTGDLVDNQLTLKRNPGYFSPGLPYLNGLIFKVVSNDESAYEALVAGTGQAAQMSTPTIITEAEKDSSLTAAVMKGTSPTLIQLNTTQAPFNNKLAREAVYYATNSAQIAAHLYNGMFPVAESFLASGGLFYAGPTVPGYLGYDLAKSKQLVSQLGGLTITLFGPNDPVSTEVEEALRQQWQDAGMKVTIQPDTLDAQIEKFGSKNWQAAIGEDGAYDPAVSAGFTFRFGSASEFSGVHDPVLDQMAAQAASTSDATQRATIYANMAKYIAGNAYAPFLVSTAPVAVNAKNVHGPGLTTQIPVPSVVVSPYWDQAWIGNS